MDQNTKIIKKFNEDVSKEFPINKIILFGSRAEGEHKRDSDFDIIIVSDKFQKTSRLKRAIKLYDYWDYDFPVDFICLTYSEFNRLKQKATIIREALKKGIEI